jgi:hypothetical protein
MELIDKKALVKYLVEVRNKIYAGDDEYVLGQKTGLVKAVDVIMTFPTVEERKQGHWVRHNDIIACSECIFDMCFDENIAELNYCPYCGAIMDGVEK